MAVAFTAWTVLAHDPIVKHSDRLWTVEGTMPGGNQRIMSVVRLDDGGLVIHNPIALDDAAMEELEAFGPPTALLVPNAFHRQDSRIWADRYPHAKVYAPAGAVKAAKKATRVDGTYADAPSDASVKVAHVPGLKEREGTVTIVEPSGTSVVFCDTLLNMPVTKGMLGLLLGPTGMLSVPRAMRYAMVSDRERLRAYLVDLAQRDDLRRLVPGHGAIVQSGVGAALRQATTTF